MIFPSGKDLMRRINDGLAQKAPTEYVFKVREKVVEGCEELLETGARIRPLLVGKQQIGWVRGLHVTERKTLQRWLHNPNEFILHALLLATTLKQEELEDFTASEIRFLAEVVKTMGEYDLSLFPYMSAYVTTMSSENLWHSRGTDITSFENREVLMPDGKKIRILQPAEHAKLWATLCTYREQAKRRLDDNWNALLVIRPWAGKSADPIAAELKGVQRSLITNSNIPWENIVCIKSDVDVSDGWAHADDTPEGMLRELKGMLANDKHEQLIDKFEKQMRDQAESRKREIERLVAAHGGPGVHEEPITISSEKEVLERQRELKKGRPTIIPVSSQITPTPEEKILKYK